MKKTYSKPVRPRGTDKAKIITVIETQSLRGLGTTEDPCRIVKQYWDFKGELLAEFDCEKTKEQKTYSPIDFLKEGRELARRR